jgi:Tol biopolymer transport system component
LLAYRDPLAFVIATIDTTGVVHEVARDSARLGTPRWSGDGRMLYWIGDPYGEASIQRVRIGRDGSPNGPPEQLLAQLEALPLNSGFTRFSMTRDGSRAVYTRGARFGNLLLAQPGDEAGSPRVTPLTQGTEDRWAPAVSPDGRRIAFVQRVGREGEVFIMPIQGGAASRITTGARIPEAGRLAWSPDGDRIAFMSVRGGYPLVHTVSLVDRFVRAYRFTRASPAGAHLSWAPSGRIAYLNMERSNVHLLDPETAVESPMIPSPSPNAFMMGPRVDPKGERIAFQWTHGQSEGQLWVHDLRDGSLRQLSRGRAAPPIGWSEDGRWIYTGASNIQRFDSRASAPSSRVMMLPLREGSCTPAGPQRPGGFVCIASDFTSDVWAIEPFDPRR